MMPPVDEMEFTSKVGGLIVIVNVKYKTIEGVTI